MELVGHILLGILDGHAGDAVAKFAAPAFLSVLQNTSQWREYAALVESHSPCCISPELISGALVAAFVDMDYILREKGFASGSTAVVTVITPTHILAASVGDSRCVVGLASGACVTMSEDHKPSLPDEKARITAAGGFVRDDRVVGELAMSRALGDFQYKANPDKQMHEQMVVPIPDIGVHVRSRHCGGGGEGGNAGDVETCILLACDGLWVVINNNEAVALIKEIEIAADVEEAERKLSGKIGEREILTSEGIANTMVDLSLGAGSTDNISVLLARIFTPSAAAASGSLPPPPLLPPHVSNTVPAPAAAGGLRVEETGSAKRSRGTAKQNHNPNTSKTGKEAKRFAK